MLTLSDQGLVPRLGIALLKNGVGKKIWELAE